METRCAECVAMLHTDDTLDDGGVTCGLLLPCECCTKEVETPDVHDKIRATWLKWCGKIPLRFVRHWRKT